MDLAGEPQYTPSVDSARIRARRWLVGAALGATWGLLSGAAAWATSPVTLGDTYVTDTADVLDASDEQRANARLAEAFDQTGSDLYVVFVDEFTDPADRIAWANQTADLNGLGESQYLLAVSTEGRQYFISALDGGPLSDAQVGRIEEEILPELRDSDWLGAVEAAADRLESEHGAGGRTAAIVVGSVVGAAGIAGASFGVVKMRRGKRARQEAQQQLAHLEQTSGLALVAADDAVKTSEQELEFARAQFGDGAVAEFATALDGARRSSWRPSRCGSSSTTRYPTPTPSGANGWATSSNCAGRPTPHSTRRPGPSPSCATSSATPPPPSRRRGDDSRPPTTDPSQPSWCGWARPTRPTRCSRSPGTTSRPRVCSHSRESAPRRPSERSARVARARRRSPSARPRQQRRRPISCGRRSPRTARPSPRSSSAAPS
ncbi:hypothetical protein Leucomu_12370 [Leucobacter muris]|uniref:TPM domain-containing protein n=1 Tax=Leucobacter muris TaxID=1935379 RepID=A0ABX5QHN0_9MICO|nr:hypothetical protein Leucomu_12370 [Leucobacter muris]